MYKKIEIFSSFYKKYHIYNDDVISPFFVGAENEVNNLHIPSDNTGDNISQKNDTYNELTLIYWAWKNTSYQDYIGFCHYRRYFTYSSMSKQKKIFNLFFSKFLNKEKKVDVILNGFSKNIKKEISQYDIILPKPIIMERTLREQYGDYHNLADYDAMGDVIKRLKPEFYDSFIDASNRNAFFIANMFIFKRGIFERFCDFIFPILFELEKSIVIPSDPYQKRIFGYLGERMVTIFINHLSEFEKPKIKYLDILNTDVIFGNFKSYLSECKKIKEKNNITFGCIDSLIDLNHRMFSISGWAIIKNKNSHDYTCQVEIYNASESFFYDTEVQTRRDVTLSIARERKKYSNHDSSGFYTSISKKDLPLGNYKIRLHLNSKALDKKCVFYVINCYITVGKGKVELNRI